LKIVCPYCRESFELEAYLKDSIMLQVIRMLPEFGGHARLVWEYAERFGISPPLNARKLYRVMLEILEIFMTGGFDFQKRRYEISREGIAQALRTVCNAQIKGALTGQNYLKRVMIPIAEAEGQKKGKENERKSRIQESGLRNQVRPGLEGDPAETGGAGNLGPLIKSFVAGLEGIPVAATKESGPTGSGVAADRPLDRGNRKETVVPAPGGPDRGEVKGPGYDPTDRGAERERALDRERGVMRPEREP
jgi:hypothetical protein